MKILRINTVLSLIFFLTISVSAVSAEIIDVSIITDDEVVTSYGSSEPLVPLVLQTSATICDNFNRPDSTSMGANWTEVVGDFRIQNLRARSSQASANRDLMFFNPINQTPQVVTMDVFYEGSVRTTYVGAVMGYAGVNDNVFVKVQDNDGNGDFERVFFYYGNNSVSPWPGMTGGNYFEDVPPFTSAHLTISYDPSAATVSIDIDGLVLTRGAIPVGSLGSGGGAVGWNDASLDNFCFGTTSGDDDTDGIPDNLDNCPYRHNPSQTDCDGDGIGDTCDQDTHDRDGDGIDNTCDFCPDDFDFNNIDTDADGFCDANDNCPNNCNSEQLDADSDGIGDVCDPDPGCGGCSPTPCEQECSA